MCIVKKKLFSIIFCLLLTVFCVHYLPAAEETGKEPAEATGKDTPSFSIKESNLTITPAVQAAGQEETGGSTPDTSSGGNQPHLTMDILDYTVGEVWEGEDIVHTFTVKNTGKAQLDITNVKAG